MGLVLFILCAFVLLTLVSGGYVFFLASRKKDMDWLDEKAVARTPYAQYYPFIVATDHWLKAHQLQPVCTLAADGVKLHGLWIPAENSRGTILMAHGYRSTMLLDFHLPFQLFHRLGFDILVPQQRTHGHSGGKYITFGIKESTDMQRWIRFHNDHLSQKPMILYGISMGASTMLYLADRVLPANVKGIIADCPFTSPREIITHVYKSVLRVPPVLSVWVAGLFARVFADFSLDACDTRRSLAHSRLPILLIHGEADNFVPSRMSREAYNACSSKKDLLIVENADHGLSYLFDGISYAAHVIDFLKENIPDFSIPKNIED